MATRARSDDPREAIQHGLRLLSPSARTECDPRDRLGERFTSGAVASAMGRLRELGYVDDRAWAAAYMQRARASLRSGRLLRRELRARGVAPDVAAEATALHDDKAALAAAGLRCGGSHPPRTAMTERSRWGGFDSAAIQRALWRLRAGEPVLDP